MSPVGRLQHKILSSRSRSCAGQAEAVSLVGDGWMLAMMSRGWGRVEGTTDQDMLKISVTVLVVVQNRRVYLTHPIVRKRWNTMTSLG